MDRSKLHTQLAKANRRLFVQTLLNRLIWCWVAALAVAAVWFLAEPWLIEKPAAWLRWAVAGGLAGAATVLGYVLAALAAPSRLVAALELDERFGLKERVTTALSLSAEQQSSAAGQALLHDVQQRVEKIDVGTRFPLRLNWSASLVPALVVALLLLAAFYELPKSAAKSGKANSLDKAPTNVAEIKDKFNDLKKKPLETRKNELPKAEEVQRIEEEIDKIANRPHDTRRELEKRVKEITELQDRIQERQKAIDERLRNAQQQLQKLERPSDAKDGPASELQKALADNNLDKAREELAKLAKKIEDKDMAAPQREQLEKQLKDMQDKLDRLARKDEEKQELDRRLKDGSLKKEDYQRELDRLNRESANLKDLKDLADQLKQAQEAMKNGNSKEAADQLNAAADKVKEMQLSDQEMRDLQDQLDRLQQAKKAAGKGQKGGGEDGDKDGTGGEGEGKDGLSRKGNNGRGGKGNGAGDTDQPNDGGIGAGRRPLGKDQDTSSFEARQKAQFDAKGRKIFDGFTPGQNIKGKSSPELAGEIKQASQEAPEAIDLQRIPKTARDMAKEYFRNLGGQGKPEEVPEKK